MLKRDDVLTRIRTVLTAVVFWIGVVGAVLSVVVAELTQAGLPGSDEVVRWITVAVGVIATLTTIIRRVSEALPGERGLLPVE